MENGKTKIVIMGKKGCRVLTNPSTQDYEKLNHLVNPNLDSVRGVSPEFWRIEQGRVVSDIKPNLPPVEYKNEFILRNKIKRSEKRLSLYSEYINSKLIDLQLSMLALKEGNRGIVSQKQLILATSSIIIVLLALIVQNL